VQHSAAARLRCLETSGHPCQVYPGLARSAAAASPIDQLVLDPNSVLTAMRLADLAGEGDLHEGHRLWPHIEGWAAELGPTGPDAIARASQPPRDINRPTNTPADSPTWRQPTNQPDTAPRSANSAASPSSLPNSRHLPETAYESCRRQIAARSSRPGPATGCPLSDLALHERLIDNDIVATDSRGSTVDHLTAWRPAI
jgi:hypothetical protein